MGTTKTPTTQQHEEDLLDEALEESFPASDVPHPAVKSSAKPAKPSGIDTSKSPPPKP